MMVPSLLIVLSIIPLTSQGRKRLRTSKDKGLPERRLKTHTLDAGYLLQSGAEAKRVMLSPGGG